MNAPQSFIPQALTYDPGDAQYGENVTGTRRHGFQPLCSMCVVKGGGGVNQLNDESLSAARLFRSSLLLSKLRVAGGSSPTTHTSVYPIPPPIRFPVSSSPPPRPMLLAATMLPAVPVFLLYVATPSS